MKLLTIGAFARAARLSPKALRLYDGFGLLRPARVDEASGYRYYSPDQLERARLVAWLRRLGMPLASIAQVCDASPAVAAEGIAAFLAVAEKDLAERRGLARFLITYLSGRETAMPASSSSLAIRYAAASDIGRERDRNQDAAYAGSRLLAVADGMGPGGHVASEAVINALRPLEDADTPGDLLNALSDAVSAATATLRSLSESDPEFADSGSTLTAMLLSGSQLALVHSSDGLTAVVPAGVIRRTLLVAGSAPSDVVARLIALANEAGGPDNIACVVADVLSAA